VSPVLVVMRIPQQLAWPRGGGAGCAGEAHRQRINGSAAVTTSDSPKTQLGSRSCDRLPCRRTSIRLAFPKVGLRHLVSAARYIRAARERAAPGFAGCSVAWPKGQRNSAVSLRSKRPKTLVALPAPPTCPKAVLFRGRRGRFSSEDAPFRGSRRHIHPRVHPALRLLHPKARGLSEFRIRFAGLIRRST